MSDRQAVEFLRRRYAAAILCDDAETAARLRARLDDVMNHPRGVGTCTALQAEARAEPAGNGAKSRSPAESAVAQRPFERPAPGLRLVTPVTRLIEWPVHGRRAR